MVRKFAAFSGACCAMLTLSCGSSDTSTHAGSSAGTGATSAGASATAGAGGSSGLAGVGGNLSNAGAAGTATGSGAGVGGTATSAGGNSAGGSSAGGGSAGASANATWRPFSDQSPWNTPIPSGTQPDTDSATMISDLSSITGQSQFWINLQDYSVPVYWVDASTASVNVAADLGGTGFRTGAADDSVAAGTGMAPIPVGALPAAGTDKHLSIVDMAAHTEWGFWNANQPAGGWTAGEASTQDLSGDGVRPPEHDNPWWAGHGPRACGFGLIAGLITVNDIKAGAIEHALVMAYPHIRSRYYTPPASSAQAPPLTRSPRAASCVAGAFNSTLRSISARSGYPRLAWSSRPHSKSTAHSWATIRAPCRCTLRLLLTPKRTSRVACSTTGRQSPSRSRAFACCPLA